MSFLNRLGFKRNIIFLVMFFLLLLAPCNAQNQKVNEFDSIRAELSLIKDKNSPAYVKLKQKLDKYVSQNKIVYSFENRLIDIYRLIQEQKFNSAIYELNDLIENNVEVSKCYELLGDISVKAGKTPNKIASYYKKSIQNDFENISSNYKLAKLYLREKKNIYGIEYLKQTIELTNDSALLMEIEDIIKNKITPNNRYEANNLYEALGQIYVKTNRNQDAYGAFSRALQLNPNDIYIKYYLSDLFYYNGDLSNAIALYDSILKDIPSDNQIQISKANSYLKDGNLLSANKEYLDILKKNPESRQAKYGIFKIFQNKLPLNEILLKVNGNNKAFKPNENDYLSFADFLDEMGEIDAAVEYRDYVKCLREEQNKKIVKNQPEVAKKNQVLPKKDINTKVNTTAANNSEKIAQQKKLQQQKLQKEKAIKEAQAKKAQEEMFAKEKLQKEKLEKEKLEKEKLLAQKLEQEKIAAQKLKEKQEQEKKILAEKKQKEYEQKRIAQEQQKAYEKDPAKYQEFKKIIDGYLKIEPKTSQIYTAIANTYKQMGEPTNALNYYKKAQKLDPTNSDIYFNLGLVYMELNSFETARYNLVKAINLDSENTKATNLLSFVNQKIITQIINSAYEKFENKDFLSAFDILNDGIKKYPKNPQLYYYRALACDSMNRNAPQIMDLQKAIELDPSYYMAYYQLGMAYEKINDEKNALVAYEKFLSIEPDEKELITEIQQKVLTLGAKYY